MSTSGVVRRQSDVFQQIAAIERLHQEGDGAISQCLSADVIVIMRGDQNDRQLTPFPSNPPLQFRPSIPGRRTSAMTHDTLESAPDNRNVSADSKVTA
jgi:hypothetical protein